MIIAVDVDGTLRDLETQIRMYLEMDYPDLVEEYDKILGKEYRTLSPLMPEPEIMTWLYDERPFELFAIADRLHPKVIEDVNKFAKVAESLGHTVVIASVQRGKSIMATLSWLSKFGCKLKHYDFFDTMQDKIDAGYDVYIDDCPEVLEACTPSTGGISPIGVRIPYEFNKHVENVHDLDIANGKFNDIYDILKIERGL